MKQIFIVILLLLITCLIDLKPVEFDLLNQNIITVNVDGAVEHPGNISLELYSTQQDALNVAIPSENADLSGINPLTILKDHDYIHVPEKKEETETKISINTATLEQLCTLNGIGSSTAQKIIDYRNEHGLFQNLEDLMNVKGIGKAKYEKIVEQISL